MVRGMPQRIGIASRLGVGDAGHRMSLPDWAFSAKMLARQSFPGFDGGLAMFTDQIDKLKSQYTDKYVVVDGSRPELARFRDITGQVKTVNMSGRALVEFQDYHLNIGWYDIAPEFLKVIEKPLPKVEKPKAEKKPAAAKAEAKPAAAKKPEAARPRGGGQDVGRRNAGRSPRRYGASASEICRGRAKGRGRQAETDDRARCFISPSKSRSF